MRNDDDPFKKLPLTEHTENLIASGDIEKAKAVHNATVKDAFDRSKRGAIIDLTDLFASSEQIHIAEYEKEQNEKAKD